MATSKADIRGWLSEAEGQGATHLIVVCDTFDWEDYPVFVRPDEDALRKAKEFREKSMQRVVEVYSLTGRHDIEDQMKEFRAFHYD